MISERTKAKLILWMCACWVWWSIGCVPFAYSVQDINLVWSYFLQPFWVYDWCLNWWRTLQRIGGMSTFQEKMSFLWSCKFVAVLWLIWLGKNHCTLKKSPNLCWYCNYGLFLHNFLGHFNKRIHGNFDFDLLHSRFWYLSFYAWHVCLCIICVF